MSGNQKFFVAFCSGNWAFDYSFHKPSGKTANPIANSTTNFMVEFFIVDYPAFPHLVTTNLKLWFD